jgi:hypothetical protein
MNVQMVAWVHDGGPTDAKSDWRFKVTRKRG